MFRKILSSRQNRFMVLLVMSMTLLIFASATVFYTLEYSRLGSFFEALWWSVVTITTVGYGDIVPHSNVGKAFGVLVIVAGFLMLSVTTALASSILISRKLKQERGLSQVTFKNHTMLCGWNKTSESVLQELYKNDEALKLVLINNLPEDEIEEILFNNKGRNIEFVRGDFLGEHILERANASKASVVIITPDGDAGSDDKTVLAAYTIRAVNQKARIFAHIKSHDSVQHLKKASVDDYVLSDSNVSFMLGHMVTDPGIPQSMRMLFDNIDGHGLERERIPDEYIGRTFKEVFSYFREKGLLPIGLLRETECFNLKSVLSGNDSFLDEFIAEKFKKAGKSVRESNKTDIKLNPKDSEKIEKGSYVIVMR